MLVRDMKGRQGRLCLQISKNSNWPDYEINLETLSDNFWMNHDDKENKIQRPTKADIRSK